MGANLFRCQLDSGSVLFRAKKLSLSDVTILSTESPTRLLNFVNLAWGLGYLGMLFVLIWQLFALRESFLTKLSTPSAKADWEDWREATAQPGPVARRVPKSDEPPTLVLLRDYFGICLTVAILFCSLLYGVFMLLIRGAFGQGTQGKVERQ